MLKELDNKILAFLKEKAETRSEDWRIVPENPNEPYGAANYIYETEELRFYILFINGKRGLSVNLAHDSYGVLKVIEASSQTLEKICWIIDEHERNRNKAEARLNEALERMFGPVAAES